MKVYLIFISIIISLSSLAQTSEIQTKAEHIVELYNSNDLIQIEINTSLNGGMDSKQLIMTKHIKSFGIKNGLLQIEVSDNRFFWFDLDDVFKYEIRPSISVMILYYNHSKS